MRGSGCAWPAKGGSESSHRMGRGMRPQEIRRMTSSTSANEFPGSNWRKVPNILIGSGAMLCLLGLWADLGGHHHFRQFGYSWLLAFMFWLSVTLGALFLVMMHHLFDAAWSVPIRRFCEHLACLVFPWMAVFFLPLALLA